MNGESMFGIAISSIGMIVLNGLAYAAIDKNARGRLPRRALFLFNTLVLLLPTLTLVLIFFKLISSIIGDR